MIGDKIQINIRNHPDGKCPYSKCTHLMPNMKQYQGLKATVTKEMDERVMIDIDGEKYGWSRCMFKTIRPTIFDHVTNAGGCGASGTMLSIEDMQKATESIMKDVEKAFSLPAPFFSIGMEPNFTSLLRKRPMDTLRSMTDALKRFIKGPFRSFYQLGWVDKDLDLTEKGGRELTLFLFEHFEKEFGEYAAKRVAELKKKEKEEESDEDDE